MRLRRGRGAGPAANPIRRGARDRPAQPALLCLWTGAGSGRLRAMRFFIRALAATLLALLLASAAGLWLALEATPRVTQTPVLDASDIARALQLLQRNDPRGKLPGITRAVTLSQRDLELLINQAGRRYGEPRARVQLQPGLARVQASLALPANPLGGWLNLDAVLRDGQGLPRVARLRVGRLPVPAWLAERALPGLLDALNLRAQGALAQRLVSRVGFGAQKMVLAYAWPDNPQQDLANSLLPAAEQARLKIYADQLARLSADLAPAGPVSITRLLPPVFALARQRSADPAAAVLENRAALVALAFLVNGQGVAALLPDARHWPRPQPLRITLLGRPDTPQHFLVSAALSAEGGGPLADAIGLYKEVADSRGGSGFSFHDLAADRAGSRLGLQAVNQPQALQARLAAGVQEADLLPALADLPESMAAREFERRFGGVGGVAYRQMVQDIEARLDRLALLGPLAASP